ncbi:hypothetical protein [Haloglomus litoreum]|uniref:hypothetical protein n=1 Tax=Haloglomus litoreum TaxID=3034026 RepID=UPI0023E85296|nr:hypothetical protein [Haloglomus sp. DT116]
MSDALDRVDCLRFPSDGPDTVRLVPAGVGERVVAAHHEEIRRRRRLAVAAAVVVTLLTGAAAVIVLGPTPVTAVGTVLVGIVMLYAARRSPDGTSTRAPELVETDTPAAEARERYAVAAASTDPFGTDDGGGVGPGRTDDTGPPAAEER